MQDGESSFLCLQGGIGVPDVGGLKWLFFDVGDTLVDEWEPVDDIIGQFVREACALGYPVKIEAVRELFANCYRKYEQWPMRVAIRTFVEDEGASETDSGQAEVSKRS